MTTPELPLKPASVLQSAQVNNEMQTTLKPKLRISDYHGFLKHLNLPKDFADIPKEVDKY